VADEGHEEVKLHALKGVLPGKVVAFYIVPLDPSLKGGAYGALAGQSPNQRRSCEWKDHY
jgi:hypothetical protein